MDSVENVAETLIQPRGNLVIERNKVSLVVKTVNDVVGERPSERVVAEHLRQNDGVEDSSVGCVWSQYAVDVE